MKKIVMIADDLTGACDSGVQFTRKGFKTVVSFEKKSTSQLQSDVTVFDTNSRAMTKTDAYSAVREVSSNLFFEDLGLVYKKIDSTLRGNLGSEIDALMDSVSFDFAVVAPALPSLGRTTRNGIHYLNKVRVELTEIANDPKTPVKESNIIYLLAKQSKREAYLFPKEFLKEEINILNGKINELLDKKKILFVFDAENDSDLKDIATSLSRLPHNILWVGSAGLAEWLPVNHVGIHPLASFPTENTLPVLVVSGSLSSLAKLQVHKLLSLSIFGEVELAPELLINKSNRESEIHRCKTELEKYLKNGLDVVFYVKQDEITSLRGPYILPAIIEESLGIIASGIIGKFKLGGVVLTGGDTAKAISKKLGVTGIELIDEVERGLPLSRMIGGPELLTVTKAGAFGTDTSLHNAVKRLKGDV